MNTTVHLRMST